ncbi:hypothetical protein FRACA_370029 [Frankia canadensis]|uniref:Uncharacterized protein n=1 Tax=Frankia canadensis TaxID=1836972 RepID=A0A2I2KVS2_9ACTN|nr:hypothetical protein FRACA_370029 [Frankia canadensis]SOU57042.1 hypothetical protein FRACA_370029 [Frankia canadensis]
MHFNRDIWLGVLRDHDGPHSRLSCAPWMPRPSDPGGHCSPRTRWSRSPPGNDHLRLVSPLETWA